MTTLRLHGMWILQVLMVGTVLTCLIVIGLALHYGSWAGAVSVLSGVPVYVSPDPVDVGSIPEGAQVSFSVVVRNAGPSSVFVLGVDDCCQCELASEVPVEIPAGGEHRLKLLFTPVGESGSEGRFDTWVPLVTTLESSRPVAVHLRGVVTADGATAVGLGKDVVR